MRRPLRPGELDRVVAIERKSVTREPTLGGETIAWVPFASSVRARWHESAGDEAVRADGRVMTRRVEVTVRWRDGVTTDMRVVRSDGRTAQIVAALEVGRRRFLRLDCEEYSSG